MSFTDYSVDCFSTSAKEHGYNATLGYFFYSCDMLVASLFWAHLILDNLMQATVYNLIHIHFYFGLEHISLQQYMKNVLGLGFSCCNQWQNANFLETLWIVLVGWVFVCSLQSFPENTLFHLSIILCLGICAYFCTDLVLCKKLIS